MQAFSKLTFPVTDVPMLARAISGEVMSLLSFKTGKKIAMCSSIAGVVALAEVMARASHCHNMSIIKKLSYLDSFFT